ncbi:type II toxin-antitoxin system YhaV family toxin [Parahaliea mediterranea]|uniref:type II toxin-antitoxin system YhaV family toxin n=1 Tax=Parahaliea mediterranea TaxID=651086 RepID=UPI000C09DB5B|nr:type II toxin-antitoxin system YhaV family toxin [Parahaliea mediterranea]MAC35354.1 toxin YhaV [Haliea sp.]
MRRHGWILVFSDCFVDQLQTLYAAAEQAELSDPVGCESHVNSKLFRALTQLVLEVVPSDPGLEEYRQANTLGPVHRHWRVAKIGRRFQLFFRYDSTLRTIVFAWVNDELALRSSGTRSDRLRSVCGGMLQSGNPSDS